MSPSWHLLSPNQLAQASVKPAPALRNHTYIVSRAQMLSSRAKRSGKTCAACLYTPSY
jgi:hypothetical protein